MRNRFAFYFLLLLVVDQITKFVFASRDFFLSGIHLHLVKNYGLSFGLNLGNLINLLVVIVSFIVFILYVPNLMRGNFNWGLPMILAGAVSNLLDRLTLGYVRDFIDLNLGFTFNVADIFIVLGLLALFLINNQEQAVE